MTEKDYNSTYSKDILADIVNYVTNTGLPLGETVREIKLCGDNKTARIFTTAQTTNYWLAWRNGRPVIWNTENSVPKEVYQSL